LECKDFRDKMQPFTLLIKPSGSDCNLDCKYCFYKNRAPEIGRGRQRMSNEVLEKLIKDYMNLKFPVAGFSWQGGEPMLLNNKNAEHPDDLFDFFIENGIKYMQFIPCVELDPKTGKVADFSVTAAQYGEFLCRLFDRWYEYGPGKLSIRDFDSILSYCITGRHTICTFSIQCSQYIVVEHTGDCFPCDFFVEPKWRLGNIFETPIEKLAAGDRKRKFARAKKQLSDKCLLCRHLDICRGGCMKDRIAIDDKPSSESYFCQSYKRFFDYAMPKFMQIAAAFAADSKANKI